MSHTNYRRIERESTHSNVGLHRLGSDEYIFAELSRQCNHLIDLVDEFDVPHMGWAWGDDDRMKQRTELIVKLDAAGVSHSRIIQALQAGLDPRSGDACWLICQQALGHYRFPISV